MRELRPWDLLRHSGWAKEARLAAAGRRRKARDFKFFAAGATARVGVSGMRGAHLSGSGACSRLTREQREPRARLRAAERRLQSPKLAGVLERHRETAGPQRSGEPGGGCCYTRGGHDQRPGAGEPGLAFPRTQDTEIGRWTGQTDLFVSPALPSKAPASPECTD